MKKRLLAILLAVVMCLAMATPAMADTNQSPDRLSNSEMAALLPNTDFTVTPPKNAEQARYWADVQDERTWSASKTQDQVLEEIKNQTSRLIAGKNTETDKANAIFKWVAANIVYDHYDFDTGKSDAIYTFYKKMGICSGYTALTNLMLTCAGLPSAYISGKAQSGGDHAWSATYADGKWIIFDSTWDEWNIGPNFHTEIETITIAPGGFTVEIDSSGAAIYERMSEYDCPSVVTIPDGVTHIGDDALEGCTSLTGVTIPNSVTHIGYGAFKGCTSLASVTIPNSVTHIGHDAFNACTSLTNVTIPNSVTFIGWSAFAYCKNLTSVTIPSSVTSIGRWAFVGTPWLEDQGEFAVANGILFSHRGHAGAVTIPSSVTTIGTSAFQDHASMTSVTIPNSVTTIESSAFDGCTGLTSVTIPSSVTSIELFAFRNCTGLTSVTIPNSVTDIGDSAFESCTGLTSVTIPNSVTSIGDSAFEKCTSLTSVTIPDSVTSIGSATFSICTSLTSVTIPNSVTEINTYAFQSCTRLKDIYYTGTEDQWKAISIDSSVDDHKHLLNATIHYNSTGPDQPQPTITFTDVPSNAYYADAVAWAVKNNITTGTSADKFSPSQNCTEIQILTFLWRAAGKPVADVTLPISVTGVDDYISAAKWAYSKEMIDATFNQDRACTRASAVKFMWQAAGSPDASDSSFTDVPANAGYAQAVAWAVKKGVTTGTSTTTFGPNDTCTRGQIVTFLYRDRAY